jgi:hypothetical protein
MPTRRRSEAPEPYRHPRLTKSPEEAVRLLDERIKAGRELSQSFDPTRNVSLFVGGAAIEDLRNQASNWSSYNDRLLRKLFDTPEVADSYVGFSFGGWASTYDSLAVKLTRLRRDVEDHVSDLEGIVEKIKGGLYDVDAQLGAIESPVPSTPRMPVAPVFHISHSTVGALNTGEVHGNIDARAAVIKSPSVEEFKAAVAEMRKLIAELPPQNRSDALDVIDHVDMLAAQPPAERRLGVLKGALAALPDTLAISAKALEAWDRYGGTIRAHLGL